MVIRKEFVTQKVSDGTSMRIYVAQPADANPIAGLIVFQEAFGINLYIRDIAERFAREGYLAVAPELFHRTAPGFEAKYEDYQSTMSHVGALTDAGVEADARAAHDWLREHGIRDGLPTAAIGFCMGGRFSFLSALTLPIDCAVSFYGAGIAPNPYNPGLLTRVAQLKHPVLLFWGGRDEYIPADQARAVTDSLRAAGKNFVNVEFSQAGHGFLCDARPSYDAAAAKQAWPLTLKFLDTYTAREHRALSGV